MKPKTQPKKVASKPSVASAAAAASGSNSSINSHFIKDLSSSVVNTFTNYFKTLQSSPKLLLIDTFCLFLVLLGAIQFLFVLVAGNFPFNAFLSGFIGAVGQFVLTISLRLQYSDANRDKFKGITAERAIGDYIFASLILHFIVYHFIN
ncbi:dolichyl-diphosphooligosaccharide-protein glycotransferase [Saccharomycopsis crataegensis]|uniref:Dolichyl-diphosphooligosaccharide--protein glycosyltransferase subunit OST2 n=1 Tax=Saccharomycopsis crataegensis TaxID=43959 RepID=A0AAV5QV74_9ASCO|nr:dolichyl-diphosphooligosaccharide-protein glycotransferase [Saccharomycopsis crataegensis]